MHYIFLDFSIYFVDNYSKLVRIDKISIFVVFKQKKERMREIHKLSTGFDLQLPDLLSYFIRFLYFLPSYPQLPDLLPYFIRFFYFLSSYLQLPDLLPYFTRSFCFLPSYFLGMS